MKNRTRVLVLAAGVLVPALAVAAQAVSFSAHFTAQLIDSAEDVAAELGPRLQGGFQLQDNTLQVSASGSEFPVCVSWYAASTDAGQGWVGLGRSYPQGNKAMLACDTYVRSGHDKPAWTFEVPTGRHLAWLSSQASTPEPRSAIVLGVQNGSQRPLFACQFAEGSNVFVGYIGDDGTCYGAGSNGNKSSASSYKVLSSSTAGAQAQPRYGWRGANLHYVPHPHAGLASLTAPVNINGIIAVNPKSRKLCKVVDGGGTWPGYVGTEAGNNGCNYFTYFNNQTQVRVSTSYSVLRVDPAKPKSAYVFGTFGGKSFYACVAGASQSNIVWGFTSNTGACTDGVTTTNQNVVIAQLPADETGGG